MVEFEKTERGLIRKLKEIKNLKKRTKIIIAVILLAAGVLGFFIFKPKTPVYEWATVEKGTVIKQVTANGTVEGIDEIDLKFKTSGTIDKILVNVGDKVKKGAVLARLDTGEVYPQYLQSQAGYSQAKAKLDQLLAGATSEEIKIAEHLVENAKTALDDAKAKAENDLAQDYNSAISYLLSSASKCNKAITDMKDMEKTYFSDESTISRQFREKKQLAEEAFLGSSTVVGAQALIDIALDDPTNENIDTALASLWTALQKTINLLDFAKTAASDPLFIGKLSSTDKTTITTDASETTSAFINIGNAQAEIANQRITNQININSAESNLKKLELDLEKLTAPPRDVDIAVYQAEVEKYKANLEEYSQKLKEASIIAPFDGTVAKIDGKPGEIVTAGAKTIVKILSPNGFQMRANIAETEIGEVDINDPVIVNVDAFPEQKFTGQILDIDPAETIIDGIVYYQIRVLFLDPVLGLRSGMSGDVEIEALKKENVLYVPQRAVITKDGEKIVRVLKGKEINEVKVNTGLRGSDGKVEIISGIEQGEKVVTYLKKD